MAKYFNSNIMKNENRTDGLEMKCNTSLWISSAGASAKLTHYLIFTKWVWDNGAETMGKVVWVTALKMGNINENLVEM